MLAHDFLVRGRCPSSPCVPASVTTRALQLHRTRKSLLPCASKRQYQSAEVIKDAGSSSPRPASAIVDLEPSSNSSAPEDAYSLVPVVMDDEEADPADDVVALLQKAKAKQQTSDPLLDDVDNLPEEFWATDKERVYLVGVSEKMSRRSRSGYTIDESLEELGRLANTAGLRVVGQTYQFLDPPNPATYIGMGKLAEISRAVKAYNVETVIFDDELSPGQLRNLEKACSSSTTAVKVADRTALILDIFSQRAQTREGQLQVDLAMTEYQLPRLTRMWSHLDRVGGGGQVKGTGEKQIETDKRLLRERMANLKKQLESVRMHRRQYRERRQQTPVPVVAIVGYTNAGKSTLLNTLTAAGVLAEDKLFATLDPTTRKVRLDGNKQILVSDTVGFIQKLPTQLVAAFRATLEEIQDATLILHVVDISHPNAEGQSDAVMKVLKDLDVGKVPIITAWNKVDACEDPQQVRDIAAARADNTVCMSGLTGEGVPELLQLISNQLEASMVQVELLLPYSAGDVLDDLHTAGLVHSTDYRADGTLVSASVPPSLLGRVQKYSTAQPEGLQEGYQVEDEWAQLPAAPTRPSRKSHRAAAEQAAAEESEAVFGRGDSSSDVGSSDGVLDLDSASTSSHSSRDPGSRSRVGVLQRQ